MINKKLIIIFLNKLFNIILLPLFSNTMKKKFIDDCRFALKITSITTLGLSCVFVLGFLMFTGLNIWIIIECDNQVKYQNINVPITNITKTIVYDQINYNISFVHNNLPQFIIITCHSVTCQSKYNNYKINDTIPLYFNNNNFNTNKDTGVCYIIIFGVFSQIFLLCMPLFFFIIAFLVSSVPTTIKLKSSKIDIEQNDDVTVNVDLNVDIHTEQKDDIIVNTDFGIDTDTNNNFK